MFQNLRRDFRRCGDSFRERVREVLLNPGVWAVAGYRYRRWVYTAGLPRLIRWPFTLAGMAAQLAAEIATGIQISAAADVGPGLYVPHTGTTVVGSGSVIGRDCTLCHGLTLGHRGGGKDARNGSPVIGDRVYIGPGSAVIGPVRVGSDAVIGVGAVVTRSVPPRAVVAGNPARVLSYGGSFDLIQYPGMADDLDRQLALAERDAVAEPALAAR
jgi:serine O-acetyltransferase